MTSRCDISCAKRMRSNNGRCCPSRRMPLSFATCIYSSQIIYARHPELVSCDWSTNLGLGILESLRRFQLLSIKGLNSLSNSQGSIQLTIAHLLKAGRTVYKAFSNI